MDKKKIVVGLSGGVDSAVAAYLLKEQGYDVTGAFMRNWDAIANNDIAGNPTLNDPMCPQEQDYEDAKKVAKQLGIPLLRVDFIKEYWDNVFMYFINEYKKGRTPNPDIFCNKYIKFDAFLKWGLAQGFDLIATGHYAKRVDQDGITYMHKSFDQNKDQTYFLSQLNQAQLKASLFPLGGIDKGEVRRIAKMLNLEVATKKDSTGVCFIGERHFKQFLHNYLPMKKGDIVDINNGKKIGTHDGVFYYTIGQRRGLGIGGLKEYKDNKSWYVCKKDVAKNILYVANDENDTHLLADSALISDVNFNAYVPKDGSTISAKFRYRQQDLAVKIYVLENNYVKLEFLGDYKAITPGQAAVFYECDICLGGGIIEEVYYKGRKIN